MKRYFNNFVFIEIISVIFISCATMVKFEIEHPPLVDMRGKKTITVIPLEWKDNGAYNFLSAEITKKLKNWK